MLAEPLLASAPPEPPPPRTRVGVLDNAKAVLICCVVLYHSAVVYSSADRPEVRARSTGPRLPSLLIVWSRVPSCAAVRRTRSPSTPGRWPS